MKRINTHFYEHKDLNCAVLLWWTELEVDLLFPLKTRN